jgi:hypothetical protein
MAIKKKSTKKSATKCPYAEGQIVKLLPFIDEGELIEGASLAEFAGYDARSKTAIVFILDKFREDDDNDGMRECELDQIALPTPKELKTKKLAK